jgi:hypothetical protein
MLKFKNSVWFVVSLAILVIGIVLFPFKDIFYVLSASVIPVAGWMIMMLLDEVEAILLGH